MTYDFISSPVRSLQGDIVVPGDKSMSHRAIILGAIAKGKTSIHGFLNGEDCLRTLKIFQSMGVEIERKGDSDILIYGVGKYGLKPATSALNCGNSGTTMRLLAGLLSAQSFDSQLIGDASLSNRPMDRVINPLLQMKAAISGFNNRAPLFIKGQQALQSFEYLIPQASAQVKSCLLLAGMYATGETSIIESKPTRDHTERMLEAFSYPVYCDNNRVTIHANGECQGTEISIPGDMSSAAFFIVAATLIPGSNLLIRNVGMNPGRTGLLQILQQMGAKIEILDLRQVGPEPIADLFIQHAPLQGTIIPKSLVPSAIDEFPALFIAAACATGETILRGADELRWKESDRISSMVVGLQQLGIDATALDDGVVIQGGTLQGGIVDSRYDHRIAMAFAIAGAQSTTQVLIKHCENVNTSFPEFIRLANHINLSIRVINHES